MEGVGGRNLHEGKWRSNHKKSFYSDNGAKILRHPISLRSSYRGREFYCAARGHSSGNELALYSVSDPSFTLATTDAGLLTGGGAPEF